MPEDGSPKPPPKPDKIVPAQVPLQTPMLKWPSLDDFKPKPPPVRKE
jgi:hypothetical protein